MIIMAVIITSIATITMVIDQNNLNICCINVLSLYSVFLCVELNKVTILFMSGLFV